MNLAQTRLGQEDSAYSTGSYSPTNTAPSQDSRYFPETNYFPPPPTQPVDAPYTPYNDYNPAHYPPPNMSNLPPTGYTPPPVNHEPGNPYAPHDNRARRPDDNVSAPSNPEHIHSGGSRLSPAHKSNVANPLSASDRIKSPVAPSPVTSKTVQFDLTPREEPSPERTPRNRSRDREEDDGRRRGDRDERGRNRNVDGANHRRDHSSDSVASDATIELPPRFDEHGRRRGDDPIADKLESVLAGLFR